MVVKFEQNQNASKFKILTCRRESSRKRKRVRVVGFPFFSPPQISSFFLPLCPPSASDSLPFHLHGYEAVETLSLRREDLPFSYHFWTWGSDLGSKL